MFYVYVIYSSEGDCYYRGFSENPLNRLDQHNSGWSTYTRKHDDWSLIHLEIYEFKREALIREKALKKYSKSQLIELAKSSKNKIDSLK